MNACRARQVGSSRVARWELERENGLSAYRDGHSSEPLGEKAQRPQPCLEDYSDESSPIPNE